MGWLDRLTGNAPDTLVEDDDEVVPARPRPTAWHEAVPRLRVAVRALSFGPSEGGPSPLRRPLVPSVVSQVAIDDEVADLAVTAADLAAWEVDEARVWEVALHNVLEAELQIAPSAVAPNAFDVVGPARFVASWLMIPDAVALAGEQLDGGTIVIAPTTDRLIIAGDGDADALARLLDWAFDEYQRSSRQLSPLPYRVREESVEPWRPAADDPCAVKVARAERIFVAVEYAAQQQALDEFFLDGGEDIFAASLFVREREDGSIWTFASWVLDVDSVLPEADFVGVVAGAGDQFMVPWAAAVQVAGDHLVPVPDLSPPRWRAPELPPNAVIEALRAHETDPTAR